MVSLNHNECKMFPFKPRFDLVRNYLNEIQNMLWLGLLNDLFGGTMLWPEALCLIMMTSSNENIFRVTGPFRGEFRWVPLTKANDAEL